VSGHGPARRRLFFAIWPDDAERRALATAIDATLAVAGGRPVPLEQLHLTLEFLGSVAAAELPTLAALGAAVSLPAGQTVVLDRLDWWRRAAMLVAVPSVPAAGLLALQADLRRALSGRGFRVDSRPFRPHVTLARKVAAPPPRRAVCVSWPIGAFALVESVPSPAGSTYTPLASWPQAGARADFSAH
jgi:RNA 2',3'-cyclic 3'-phosphodiesterase